MKEPNEKWLDRHFKQQHVEYRKVFKEAACASDQHIIAYWLKIFGTASKQQKWARNGLMLLMYGHLKEIGHLQVPFTDMRNLGKDLNEVLDSYTGLPVKGQDKSTQIQSPLCKKHESEEISHKEGIKDCAWLQLEQGLTTTVRQPSLRHVPKLSCRGFRSTTSKCKDNFCDISLPAERLQILYDTFDSHECYKDEVVGPKTQDRILNKVESEIMQELNAILEPVNDLKSLPESRMSATASEMDEPCCKSHSNKMEHKGLKAASLTEEYPSYCVSYASEFLEENTSLISEHEDNKDKQTVLGTSLRSASVADKGCQESPRELARREALDAELMYLQRRNRQLRRECLIYYKKNGDLRRHPKYPKVRVNSLGFLVGAYRAHCHFTRWPKSRNYFQQEFDRVNGWRTYRRILLDSSRPSRRSENLQLKRTSTLR
ncbi:uncharacterized protein [Drosophila virilis]|uniref:DUF4485 domain-containing protein n=1 Tax=Drosophila virilis TaxID=7244 RepID=B4LCB1_DROVI|nr:uncharacterized protein LOC6622399 [Drosophila virilis]EDW68756.1 uncharacterized protein Dvir_GJ12517 [Drosophila virilis]